MLNFSANLSFLFTEVEFRDRFAAAAAAGFQGVEFQFPEGFAAQDLADYLIRHALELVLMNMPAGDAAAGDRGLACLPDRIDEFEHSVARAADYAITLGCDRLHCMAGVAPEDAEPAAVRETYVRNLRFVATACAPAGITVQIEPINTRDIPGYYLNHTDQALAIMDEVAAPNLALQFDIYHRQIMDGDILPTLERVLDRTGHIQIADTPGRHEPGTGEINYAVVLRRLEALGYDRWIGCEYIPLAGTLEGLHWIEPYRPDQP